MPVSKEMITVLACNRCEHRWVQKDPWQDPDPDDLPRVCPKCKSPYWNTERTFPKPAAKKKVRAKRAKK
jgi:hypothetical protein